MKPRRWVWLAAAAGLLAAADTALWWSAERALSRGFADWVQAMAAQGLTATAGPARLGGWPLSATMTLPALSLRAAGGASLRVEPAVLSLSALHPRSLRVTLPGMVAARAPGLPPADASAAVWSVEMPFDRPGMTEMDARDLRVGLLQPNGQERVTTAALAHLQVSAQAAGTRYDGSAQSIGLPSPLPGEVQPLGPRLASLAFEAVVRGDLSAFTLNAATLAAWRDAGGAVEVSRLALGYGPLGLSGQGRFRLDAQLQPEGEASLRIIGYAQTIQALVGAKLLSAHAATAAGAVLGLLARPPEGGGASQVQTTASLLDGVLTVAGFPLLRVANVAWPTQPASTPAAGP